MIRGPALCYSPLSELTLSKTHDFSTPVWRFMKGSPEDRLTMLLASFVFMNFVLVVSILLIFSVTSINESRC